MHLGLATWWIASSALRGGRNVEMAITPDRVREIFKGLENGDGADFFESVAEDVDWTVMGTHPLAGHYRSKKDSGRRAPG
jgi:hypothetical protein